MSALIKEEGPRASVATLQTRRIVRVKRPVRKESTPKVYPFSNITVPVKTTTKVVETTDDQAADAKPSSAAAAAVVAAATEDSSHKEGSKKEDAKEDDESTSKKITPIFGSTKGRRRVSTKSQLCVICQDSFDCSLNYKGQKFACLNCRMSSEALERGFTCPITNTIMFNPTVASDGHCYEKHAIQVWIATAVDNEKRPLSPVTGLPLANFVLKNNKKMLKEIELWVVTNKLQHHPDRVKPPTTTDIEQRQRDISTQAAQWLTQATPGKQGGPGATETMDMTEYAAQSARRRKEEIAAGADLALAVRFSRRIADLLKALDCVRSTDTLATAIGSSIDFLPPNAVNDCFYICRERNRIVHESSAGDELRDVRRFRTAFQRARREIQIQIDIQESYKSPPPVPVPPFRSLPAISNPPLASSPRMTSSMSSPNVRRPTTSVVSETPSPFTKLRASSVSPSAVSTSSSSGSSWTPSPAVVKCPSPFLETFNNGVNHFNRGEYPQAIKVLTDFTQQVDGTVYPNRLARAKSTIAMAKSRPESLKKADYLFRKGKIRGAFDVHVILVNQVRFEEGCYAMVWFRLGTCCTPKTGIDAFSKALKKEPGNGIFLHHRAQAYMEVKDFKSAMVDLESIDLATLDAPMAKVATEALATCKTQTDPMYKRGHLKEDEIDELMQRFGLED